MIRRLGLCLALLFFCTVARADTFTPSYTAVDDQVANAADVNKWGSDVQTFMNNAKVATDNITDGTIVNADVSAAAAIDDKKIEGGTTSATMSAMMASYRYKTRIYPKDGDEFYVGAGQIRVTDENKTKDSALTISGANLDTSDDLAEGYYYVYATADTSDKVFAVKISASSTTPTGPADYRRIGWLYNGADGDTETLDIEALGDDDYGSVNQVVGTDDITTTSGTYADMDDMVIYHVSNGIRPTKIHFTAPISVFESMEEEVLIAVNILVGATEKINTRQYRKVGTGMDENQTVEAQATVLWSEVLSSGEHTIKIQWFRTGTFTAVQNGSTQGERILIVED